LSEAIIIFLESEDTLFAVDIFAKSRSLEVLSPHFEVSFVDYIVLLLRTTSSFTTE
jgi:hypothetical protein